MTVANELAEFISTLRIGQGRHAGKLFEVLPWQKRFLRGAFGQPDDGAVSMGRGNGKSTFIAGIALGAVVGPLQQPMAEIVVVASSFAQAKIVFKHVLHFAKPWTSPGKDVFRITDSQNSATFEYRPTGTVLKVIGSDARRAHGLAPSLIVIDELAQWLNPEAMLAALETSRGKIPDSKALYLGTRPESEDHAFAEVLNGGVGYSQVHAAKRSDPPFQKRTWRKSNPSLPHMPDLEAVIRREANKAKDNPHRLASFRALRLNLGVSDTVENVLLEAEQWLSIEIQTAPEPGGAYILGLDLGQSAAMSAAAAYWMDSGVLDAFACFPHNPTLAARGLTDGVGNLYEKCHRNGELILEGSRVSDIEGLLGEVLDRWGRPAAIVIDRWREQELREKLEAVGFPMSKIVVRGMGFKDGSQDVRSFRRACMDGKVSPVRSLLMRSAMAGARVTGDPAGNWKLAKGGQGRKVRLRDDAVAAAILAVAEGRKRAEKSQPAGFNYLIA